ncbi:hypothetical protein BDV97DRAFT_396262 [Delphinella strobiligena]|nr:hypothetical protein BDV97DRAFT_396262 [Delphinella strobiligena]
MVAAVTVPQELPPSWDASAIGDSVGFRAMSWQSTFVCAAVVLTPSTLANTPPVPFLANIVSSNLALHAADPNLLQSNFDHSK